MHRDITRYAALAAIVIGAVSAAPASAAYPDKPIRVIVPVSTGGGTDLVARHIAQKLTESWGQSVIIDNRPGAGGNIGAHAVSRADPDGYTMMLTYGANITVNPSLYKQVPFDPIKDFTPITQVAAAPYLIIVNPSVQARSVRELIALMKQKKENWSFASAAVGSPDHLSGELFKMMAGVEMENIPYKGGGPALVDVRGGRVPMSFSTIPAALPHLKADAVRALAITDTKRSKLFPELPTVAETLPGYEILTWYGIWGPPAMPSAIVDKWYKEVKRIVALPEVNAFLEKNGFSPVASSPAEYSDFIRKETRKYADIIKAAKVRPID
jgi:tripartite-type tricarboxylate transporter receptor subunit TctC